eukprot:TRINITY_DN10582_c0_g1_i1.p2 TRINITY_DN10582_c0_g1~~TRINITY_DN10582_c0_g1_i1.p2  ORF type:complete len:227 (+),score=33.56 TRINITY_DN10582_c0_g1_i1:110-790(+)
MLQLSKNDAITAAAVSQAGVRQSELDFYIANFGTLSTSTAINAGFVFAQLTNPVPEGTNLALETVYLVSVALTLFISLCVITWTMIYTILGPGLALRGPEGMKSFHQAVTDCKSDTNLLYNMFLISNIAYFVSICCQVWVYPSDFTSNMACMVVFALTLLITGYYLCKLELRIGGSFIPHTGADGQIQGFGIFEEVADLDSNLAKHDGAQSAMETMRTTNATPGLR